MGLGVSLIKAVPITASLLLIVIIMLLAWGYHESIT